MRIVLDANILVRANIRSRGPARELLDIIRSNSAHVLILSRHILEEVGRTLLYPRLKAQYQLSEHEVREHVDLLRSVSTVVEPVMGAPVVERDPADDAVVYTAVEGRADILCTRDTDLYTSQVIAFCRRHGIQVMNDVDLLQRLR
jgi:putative PIN family toxin of toxin-antitoxin system